MHHVDSIRGDWDDGLDDGLDDDWDDDWDGAVDDWNDVDDSPGTGDCLNDDDYFFVRCDFDDGFDDDYPLQAQLREPLPDLLLRKVSQLHPLCSE